MAGINGGILGPANTGTSGMFTMDEIPFGSRFGGPTVPAADVQFLLIGGGGSGGGGAGSWGGPTSPGGGGGGAGGWLEDTALFDTRKTYHIVIGASNGNSTITPQGGTALFTALAGGTARSNGGSGGGAEAPAQAGPFGPGKGTPGQGFDGGGANFTMDYGSAGGGGGAGGAGGHAQGNHGGGNGGAGKTTNITGVPLTLASGGAGHADAYSGTVQPGGGGTRQKAGAPNTGGGGGAQAAGGTGVCYIRYPGAQKWNGGNVTTIDVSGVSYTLHSILTTTDLIPLP